MTNTVYSMLWKAAISLMSMLGHYHGETFKICGKNYFKFMWGKRTVVLCQLLQLVMRVEGGNALQLTQAPTPIKCIGH